MMQKTNRGQRRYKVNLEVLSRTPVTFCTSSCTKSDEQCTSICSRYHCSTPSDDQERKGRVSNTHSGQHKGVAKRWELLKVVQMVAESLQQQIVLGMRKADMSQQRTDALIGELIKLHNRRDMDHILNNISTFNGLDPEKCVDWAMRIRIACEQLNRDFRQELMNKSDLMVQNFIKGLGTDISDDEIMNRMLGFFSDIPTPYHAMDKIKSIKQNDEPMP